MLADLLSLPPRELDARLATCIEPKPVGHVNSDEALTNELLGIQEVSERGAWIERCDYDRGDEPEWEPMAYSDPSSPRSLLDGVEAEIQLLGLAWEYADAIFKLTLEHDKRNTYPEFKRVSAPAHIRAAAAVWAMEGKG